MAANDWSERTRMIVTGAIGVVVNIGLGVVLYSAHGDYEKLVATHVQKNKQIDDLTLHAIKERPDKDARLRDLKAQFETRKEKLPESDQITKLIDDLAPISEKDKCRNIAKEFMDPTDEPNLRKTTWKTRWVADFFGWCKLVNEVEERFPRFISFESMSFTPKNQGMNETGTGWGYQRRPCDLYVQEGIAWGGKLE